MEERKQYRFERNEEKTSEIQQQLFAGEDSENYRQTPLGKVILQHFILDDTLTGESLHLINPYNVAEGGVTLCYDYSFEETKDKILEIIRDRGNSSMRFYYDANLYQINSDGNCFVVKKDKITF